MKVNFKTTYFTARVKLNTRMGSNMKAPLKTAKCMDLVPIYVKMAQNMKVGLKTIIKMGMEFSIGQMVRGTKDNGLMENSMEMGRIRPFKAKKCEFRKKI